MTRADNDPLGRVVLERERDKECDVPRRARESGRAASGATRRAGRVGGSRADLLFLLGQLLDRLGRPVRGRDAVRLSAPGARVRIRCNRGGHSRCGSRARGRLLLRRWGQERLVLVEGQIVEPDATLADFVEDDLCAMRSPWLFWR
jgi:hypothetical protein